MEFLLLCNKFSSRSFNEYSQYPIFPWVIKDFTSNILEFSQRQQTAPEKIYRDLSKTAAGLNEAK